MAGAVGRGPPSAWCRAAAAGRPWAVSARDRVEWVPGREALARGAAHLRAGGEAGALRPVGAAARRAAAVHPADAVAQPADAVAQPADAVARPAVPAGVAVPPADEAVPPAGVAVPPAAAAGRRPGPLVRPAAAAGRPVGAVVRPVGAVVSAAAAGCAWQSCRSVMAQDTTPPQIPAMLIDVHAHFYHDRTLRADWRERNASRLRAGERIGITTHVASILGSFGRTSPTYFPSPADLEYGNNALIGLEHTHPDRIRGYVTVNPNYAAHARVEIQRGLAAGMIGIKLAASRRASDPLLDPICELARERGVPVLHHVWQHRRRDWPGQEASDAVELCVLAARHPDVRFILAHIGGGGDWQHSLAALARVPNVAVDLSGSGVDGGMLESCLAAVGVERLVWGTDLTMDTGWAKLRYLERLLAPKELELVRWKNAARLFPHGVFPSD